MPGSNLVLVTGSSGYVGGRLVPALLDAGAKVRCLVRTPGKLDEALWRPKVEIASGSVGSDLAEAMAGIDVAVYLVHSIGQGNNWVQRELTHAKNFARYAAEAGVKRIVYLGGLGRESDYLSRHLKSRHAVGQALASTGIGVVELRAGVIIGSGSASFEMLRYLVEVLPIMVTPKWVSTKCQPIAIRDVLELLVQAITDHSVPPGIYEIGGPDVVTYAEMMGMYAQVAGLPRRRLIKVPFLTPGLSSHWVGLVTPVPAQLARELVESLVNEVIVRDNQTAKIFSNSPMDMSIAIQRSLAATREDRIPTTFVDADMTYFGPTATDPAWSGGTVLTDVRTATSTATPTRVFETITAIGGQRGWYSGQVLWRLRGLVDQIVGGPGIRRGRRHNTKLRVGDPVDFWRVEVVAPLERLRLHAEMRLPGDAWLNWDVIPFGTGGSRVTQTAEFRPRGLWGRLYWYSVAPFHFMVFPGLLKGILKDSETDPKRETKNGN
jgi:uncharacterized protein YbjT (DUF2867 family)